MKTTKIIVETPGYEAFDTFDAFEDKEKVTDLQRKASDTLANGDSWSKKLLWCYSWSFGQ